MAKRSRSLMEEEEEVDHNDDFPANTGNDLGGENDSDYAVENENEMSVSRKMSEDVKLAVKNIIRMAMSRNLKGQVIKREHMTQCAGSNRVKFDTLLKEVNDVLEKVYGLSIQLMPNIGKNTDKNNGIHTQNKAKQTYCIVSCLSNSSKQVLNELWSAHIDNWPLSRKLHENQYFLFKNINNEPMKNIDLVKSGILLLILSVLVISENHLLEQELVKILKRYGLSENLNIRNSNLNLNLYDLLSEFRKKDYLEREIVKGSTESENHTEYYLGKRALTEFPPESMFEYLKTLYLNSFDEQTAKKFTVTIERAYGVKLSIYELFNQPEYGANNSDRFSSPDDNPSQINSASETSLGLSQPE